MPFKDSVFCHKRTAEAGRALVYILIAIALMAALAVSFIEPSSQQTSSSRDTFKVTTAIQSQVDSIRSAMQECVLLFPDGDVTINTGTEGTDPGANIRFPINPDSDHYASATPGKSGDRLVRNMRCPGDSPGTPNEADHSLVFTGQNGKALGPAPDLFEDWQIYNGTDGVFYWTETSDSDESLVGALQKLDEKYPECEADIIDATEGAQALDSASPASVSCPEGTTCFRIWVVQEPTAVFNGDSDGDETLPADAPPCPKI
ncbi:MAG: hypothetical protein JKY71_05560 [Alphaproteobacteria bacterium]|nr:hypothetical protein [Alphaproteobacteria bacterium]